MKKGVKEGIKAHLFFGYPGVVAKVILCPGSWLRGRCLPRPPGPDFADFESAPPQKEARSEDLDLGAEGVPPFSASIRVSAEANLLVGNTSNLKLPSRK
ncbi:MAG TPA: hypothetical protein HA349_04460 [Methanotrichaceae archaeon]|nr:hypothetical protein [Methanotrichaceae archaeon]